MGDARRFDPRQYLRSEKPASRGRRATVLVAAAIGAVLAGAGVVVSQADDANVYGFVRQSARAWSQDRAAVPRVFAPPPAPRPAMQAYAPVQAIVPLPQGALQNRLQGAERPVAERRVVQRAAVDRARGNGRAISHCVRSCDGFYFPLAHFNGDGAAHEAACQRLCPTGRPAVFVGEVGQPMEEARALRGGATYASQRGAFTHRQTLSRDCSCSALGEGLTHPSILMDPTLQRGDVAVLPEGLRVLRQGGRVSYRNQDFTSLAGTRELSGEHRQRLEQLERATARAKRLTATVQPALPVAEHGWTRQRQAAATR